MEILHLRLMLLSLNNITFEFGARKILDQASWHIYHG